MCGILGAVSLSTATLPDGAALRRMAATIWHRGPDDDGFHLDPRAVVGMRRLSIIDVEGGHQPLSNEAGAHWLVCNGEIYNFRELRAELAAKGYRFKTGSDCEVILHLYAEYGDSFVDRLNGMYGFALWDSVRGRLLLGRDRLGIKPLYYTVRNGSLLFASEIKGILAAPGVSASIDAVALAEYLSLGYVPSPMTLLEGIRKLPPATLMVVENGGFEISRYWRLPDEVDYRKDESEWARDIRKSLERSVHAQMVSDVPIGAFLSGGIDSSAVVAFMAKHSTGPVKTYSIGFEGGGAEAYYNELPYAAEVSRRFKTEHREILVRPDVVRLLPRLIWHLDEPVADSAIVTTFLVSEFARQDVKVILSGVGGDELFGGYRRYLGAHYERLYRRVPSWMRTHVLQRLASRLPSDRHSPLLNWSRLLRSFLETADRSPDERYRGYVQVFQDSSIEKLLVERCSERWDALGAAFEDDSSSDPLQRLLSVDLRTQLPDDLLLLTDKMTMASSLECRVPFLDHELVELGARVPARHRIRGVELKYILKRALDGVLPAEILNRKKRGFGAPVGAWLKRQLAPTLRELLSRKSIEARGLLRWEAVRQVMEDHDANRADHTDHLSALMNLEIWCRIFLDGKPHQDVAETLLQGVASGNPVRVPSIPVSA
jgi:asparagine synthase (glutamine-hydrolysing)